MSQKSVENSYNSQRIQGFYGRNGEERLMQREVKKHEGLDSQPGKRFQLHSGRQSLRIFKRKHLWIERTQEKI